MGQEHMQMYSTNFKLQVLEEIERGEISMTAARKKYGIGGKETISRWRRKYCKKSVDIENPQTGKADMNKEEKIKKLENEKQKLESALAQAHLKILAQESLLEEIEESRGIELKKKNDTEPFKGLFISKKEKKKDTR